MTRRQIFEQAFAAYGIVDAARLESYLLGCDLNKPVASVRLRVGDRFQVWVRDGGIPGKFGAPIGEDPKRLGIMIEGRHRETFAVRRPFVVVACVAADFPSGLIQQVGGNGGGTQCILPPDWLEKVERTS
jgi:hypothetical protein